MNKDMQGWIYGSSMVAIVVAIYLFVTGKKDTAIFIGLWAPTILSLGAFFNSEVPPANNENASSN